jgi:integrase
LKPSSHLRQRVVLNSLNPYFGTMMVRGITKAHIEKWASARSQTCAARTFNQERATLSRLFVYAMRDGLVLDNPATVVKRLKPTKDKAVIPTKKQFKSLIEAIRALKVTAHDAANLCELLAYSGCRLGEATSMQWGDVNFAARQFTVTGGELGTKNHEARTVPLFPALERFLVALRASLPHPPEASARIIGIDSAKKAIATACRQSNLPEFTHHHLRHFFCSNAIEAGVDFKTIAGWLGHKDGGILVAKTYGHLRDEHSAAMATRMTFDVVGADR